MVGIKRFGGNEEIVMKTKGYGGIPALTLIIAASLALVTCDPMELLHKVEARVLRVPVTGVSITKDSTSILVGGTEQLFATVTPIDATVPDITWASGDEVVATVDANGIVTGVAAGSATITVTTADGGFTDTCGVTVSANEVPVTGVSLNKATTSILVGGTEQLTATITPSNATNQNVTWASNNETKATVSAAGLVTAVAVGSATITVITADGGFTDACGVTVGSNYVSANIGTLKYVPAGTFQRDATPANTSTVSAFRMSEKEITRAQFAAMLITDPSNGTYSSGTSDPVQMTNWYHAIAFCNKLSIDEGLSSVYSVSGVNFTTLTYGDIPTTSNDDWNAATATWTNNGYRLPTEMEWMWAAMGATAGTTGYSKAFAGSTGSNAIGDYAVFGYYGSETGRTTTERTNPVGSKTSGANELGLYDMSGNVWEWNWDWYGSYPSGAVTDYRGAASGAGRVLRGGSWIGDASDCTVAYRYYGNPYFQYGTVGFRVVRP